MASTHKESISLWAAAWTLSNIYLNKIWSEWISSLRCFELECVIFHAGSIIMNSLCVHRGKCMLLRSQMSNGEDTLQKQSAIKRWDLAGISNMLLFWFSQEEFVHYKKIHLLRQRLFYTFCTMMCKTLHIKKYSIKPGISILAMLITFKNTMHVQMKLC